MSGSVRTDADPTAWRRIARASAPLALAIVVAACGGGGKSASVALGPQVPAGHIVGGAKAKAIQADASKAVTAAKAEAARQKEEERLQAEGPRAPEPPPPGQATEADPPTPGDYHYVLRGSGTQAGATAPFNDDDSILRIGKNFVADRGAQRQTQEGAVSICGGKCTLLYQADQASLESVGIPGGECKFTPALMLRPVPLTTESTWASQGSCQGATTKIDGDVVKKETVKIGGRNVETFVIHLISETKGGTGPDQFTQTTDALLWFSPVYRVLVKLDGKSKVTSTQGSSSSTYRATIKRLTPS